jgi:hypothetical protein
LAGFLGEDIVYDDDLDGSGHVELLADTVPELDHRTFLLLFTDSFTTTSIQIARYRAVTGSLIFPSSLISTRNVDFRAATDGLTAVVAYRDTDGNWAVPVDFVEGTPISDPKEIPSPHQLRRFWYDGLGFNALFYEEENPKGGYLYRLDSNLDLVPRELGGYKKFIDEKEVVSDVASMGDGMSLVVYDTYDSVRLGQAIKGRFIENGDM